MSASRVVWGVWVLRPGESVVKDNPLLRSLHMTREAAEAEVAEAIARQTQPPRVSLPSKFWVEGFPLQGGSVFDELLAALKSVRAAKCGTLAMAKAFEACDRAIAKAEGK